MKRCNTEPGIVEFPGVAADAGNDHLGLEELGVLLEGRVVDQPGGGVHLGQGLVLDKCVDCPHLVGHRLEEDGGGGDLGLAGVEAVGEVAAVRQVQAHDTAVGLGWGGSTRP